MRPRSQHRAQTQRNRETHEHARLGADPRRQSVQVLVCDLLKHVALLLVESRDTAGVREEPIDAPLVQEDNHHRLRGGAAGQRQSDSAMKTETRPHKQLTKAAGSCWMSAGPSRRGAASDRSPSPTACLPVDRMSAGQDSLHLQRCRATSTREDAPELRIFENVSNRTTRPIWPPSWASSSK